ncbi:MAG: YrdB family protein [Candidatus Thorarchaeota archaeon]
MREVNERKSVGANDLLRFILELWALVVYGYWGLNQNFGLFNYVLMIGAPIIVAVLWGTFAVPNDPSRSGGAPVPVPGAVRLLLEFLVLGLAFWIMFAGELFYLGLIYGALVIIHYIIARDRIKWLLGQKG